MLKQISDVEKYTVFQLELARTQKSTRIDWIFLEQVHSHAYHFTIDKDTVVFFTRRHLPRLEIRGPYQKVSRSLKLGVAYRTIWEI